MNPDLLDTIYNIPEFLFQVEMHIARLSNNSHELISRKQQRGVLSAVRSDLYTLTRALEGDSSGLGRWNIIDIQLEQCKVRFICAYHCMKSKQAENTVYMQ